MTLGVTVGRFAVKAQGWGWPWNGPWGDRGSEVVGVVTSAECDLGLFPLPSPYFVDLHFAHNLLHLFL